MGTSWVEIDGQGFWTGDSALELWLFLLAERTAVAPVPEWFPSLRDHWRIQATEGFNGRLGPA